LPKPRLFGTQRFVCGVSSLAGQSRLYLRGDIPNLSQLIEFEVRAFTLLIRIHGGKAGLNEILLSCRELTLAADSTCQPCD
jgi:hypothetical protein